jgi:hypothetical protein
MFVRALEDARYTAQHSRCKTVKMHSESLFN